MPSLVCRYDCHEIWSVVFLSYCNIMQGAVVDMPTWSFCCNNTFGGCAALPLGTFAVMLVSERCAMSVKRMQRDWIVMFSCAHNSVVNMPCTPGSSRIVGPGPVWKWRNLYQ